MLHEDVGRLRRHRKPEGVNGFPAAAAVPVPIVCFPNDQQEPAVAALGWDEETWDKFSKVVNSYNAVRNHQLGYPARNLVLGYADYEQNFVEQVAARDLQLLFQLASDDNAAHVLGRRRLHLLLGRPSRHRGRGFHEDRHGFPGRMKPDCAALVPHDEHARTPAALSPRRLLTGGSIATVVVGDGGR